MTQQHLLRSQKGAMFGLDARIALAIFGGLSVIAGAAIIGVISQTNVNALATECDNLAKGYISMVLDTGVDSTTFADLYADNSNSGWAGPYITMRQATHQKYYTGTSGEGTWSLVEGREDTSAVPPATCSAGVCSIWAKLTTVPTKTTDALDLVIDGVAGATAGNFRYKTTGEAGGVDNDMFCKLSRKL